MAASSIFLRTILQRGIPIHGVLRVVLVGSLHGIVIIGAGSCARVTVNHKVGVELRTKPSLNVLES